jgi:FolB domain-containing protein
MDVVRIVGLELDCIVGIFAFERDREQRVRLDVAMSVDARKAGRSGRIAQTVDYSVVAQQLMEMLHFRRYQLIEMAAEELSAMALATQPELAQVQLSIEKPGALEGRAQAARVEVTRTRADYEWHEERRDENVECRVLRTRDAVLSLVDVGNGQSWAPAYASGARCLSWLCSGRLRCGDRNVVPGEPQVWQGRHEPAWVNPEEAIARAFYCTVRPESA